MGYPAGDRHEGSHAVKNLTAIILAGGRGTRMDPWKSSKCIVPLKGVPIIMRILDELAPHVDRAIVCTGYRASDVEAALAGYEKIPLVFSNAGEDASMIARIKKAILDNGISQRIMINYGDEWADVDIKAMLSMHDVVGGGLSVAAHPVRLPFSVASGDFIEHYTVYAFIGWVIVSDDRLRDLLAFQGEGLSGFIASFQMPPNISYHYGKRVTFNSFHELEQAERAL